MAIDLAPIYLDDARVQLQGDPRPKVAKIMAAGGKSSGHVRIVRLAAIGDESGEALQLDDVIDRAQQRAPVYLRSITEEAGTKPPASGAFRVDEASGVGNKPKPGTQFGAGRPGMAGQGAQGSPGKLPLDKQAKSDYAPEQRKQRNGGDNQTYGVGDLAPGGRTGITEPGQSKGTGTGVDRAILDGTQEFQSGGRQGEGGAPGYRDADVGSRGVDVEDGREGGGMRDQSTDRSGRQQGQRPKRPAVAKSTKSNPGDKPAADAEAAD